MHLGAQFRERGVGPLLQQLDQALFAHFGQLGFSATSVGLRLQCAACFILLAHPPYGGHAVAKAGGDLDRCPAFTVKFYDPLAHRNWNGSHVQSLTHRQKEATYLLETR